MERSWVRKWVIGEKSCVSKTTVLTEKQCGKNHEGKVSECPTHDKSWSCSLGKHLSQLFE